MSPVISMGYENIDNEELLHLSLEAIGSARDADALDMLKTLVERDPGHLHAQYLLASQHAQIGLLDRAEDGFRAAAGLAPTSFPMPRFQLGQLLLLKEQRGEAIEVLTPLLDETTALGCYAYAMVALANGDTPGAIRSLRQGIQEPQPISELANDMKRLLSRLELPEPDSTVDDTGVASLLLSNYSRH